MPKPKIKICGIQSDEEVLIMNREKPEYIGFVFAESKRKVDAKIVCDLKKALDKHIKTVGVFADQPPSEVLNIAKICNLDVIQLHGRESINDIKKIKEQYDKEIWKSIAVKEKKDLQKAFDFDQNSTILLDSFSEQAKGGTGYCFDWNAAKNFSESRNYVLAGGLTPDNIVEAIKKLQPAIVDVSSGVETGGKKDQKKVKEFIRRVRTMKTSSYFLEFGGQFVPESLMNPLKELEKQYEAYKDDQAFKDEYLYYLKEYVGRPSPLYYAKNLTRHFNGAKIYLKREDLNHTGAHKINNVIGQLLLAKKMGKKKVIAETGAGMHGVATATGASLFNMECIVYMGEEDIKRQEINVFKMRLLGATVVTVSSGSRTLKDATNEAIRSWVANAEDTFYVIGSVVGPHPYPTMVRDFQKIIGEEVKKQIAEKEGRQPDVIVACVGGGSNAMGIFYPYLDLPDTKLIGVEAAGKGIETHEHASAFAKGRVGVLHGMKTYLLQDQDGQILPAHSVSAGLDYPGTGPEHAALFASNKATYTSITDDEAIEAFYLLTKIEGIIPALESSHAIAEGGKIAATLSKDAIIVINLSGRGDKDIHTVAELERSQTNEQN